MTNELRDAMDRRLSALAWKRENGERVLQRVKGEIIVKKRITVGLVFAIVLVLAATAALAATVLGAKYEKVGFVDNPAYAKWSIWVGGMPELDRIDALVDVLSEGVYEEEAIMDAAAKANPDVHATEKKALRTALYSFWNVADPDYFDLDMFEPSRYEASVEYEESAGTGVGTWHVRLNPVEDNALPYYYAEVNAMDNQLIRIHKLNEDGTKTLKIIYFGAIEWDYDEFIAMGESG